LRRFGSFLFACALTGFAGSAHAQQLDLAVNGSTLFSTKSISASQAFQPPPEKGGLYVGGNVSFIRKSRFGLNAELLTRYKEARYDVSQHYRPILYDVNAVFAPTYGKKYGADFMAGVGGQTLLFYGQSNGCTSTASGCSTYLNSNHFMAHLGAGVRYYFWRDFFARGEVHYYRVVNNYQFHSDNVMRAGVSIGYTFK